MKTEEIAEMRVKLEKATKLSDEIASLLNKRNDIQNAKTILIQSNYNGATQIIDYSCSLLTNEEEKAISTRRVGWNIVGETLVKEIMEGVKVKLLERYDEEISRLRLELEAL